jgi:membrane associated rhomboid family serine protease
VADFQCFQCFQWFKIHAPAALGRGRLALAGDTAYVGAVMDVARFEAPAPDGSRPSPPGRPDLQPAHEPIVNAPWPVVALVVAIIVIYALQTRAPLLTDQLAFSPRQLLAGHPEGLITHQFLHGNWAHALMNAGFVLAFGAPVARFFGPSLRGALVFFVFFLTCGVLAALGFAAFNWGADAPLVGASGAASGLMGAAARLIGGHGEPGPMFSRSVTGLGFGWILVNALMATPLLGGLFPGAGEAGIAWQAHLTGFAVGVLLITPFGWLSPRR